MTQLRRCNIPTPFETPCVPHTHLQPPLTSIWTVFRIFSHLSFTFLPPYPSSLFSPSPSLLFQTPFLPTSHLPPPLFKKMVLPLLSQSSSLWRQWAGSVESIRQEPGWAGKRRGGEVLCFCHRRGVVGCTALGEEEAHSKCLIPLLAVWR